jgi:hypothetical protein
VPRGAFGLRSSAARSLLVRGPAARPGEEVTMIQITLSDEEAGSLKNVLESYLSDLRMEIADTEQMDFRDSLKRQEEFLNGLLARLHAGRGA